MNTRARLICAVLAVAVLIVAPVGQSADSRAAREFPGACPGEGGCTFGVWTAKEDVAVYTERTTTSAVLYRIKKGEKVRGLEAVLHVVNPRTCTAQKSAVGYLSGGRERPIPAGTRLTIFYYEGEGYALTEYQKTELSVNLSDDSFKCSENEPDEILWLKIRSKSGRVGWSKDRAKFIGTSQYD
jgi:hypothetical protein